MTNPINKEVEESWHDRFAKRIVPSIDDALYEYHFTENHENPRQCVYDDLKYIEEFIAKELHSTRAEAREEVLQEITKRMKIAAIIKPPDRTGLMVWLDDETLSEDDEIWLLDGNVVKALSKKEI